MKAFVAISKDGTTTTLSRQFTTDTHWVMIETYCENTNFRTPHIRHEVWLDATATDFIQRTRNSEFYVTEQC
jgi:hypothetical protein